MSAPTLRSPQRNVEYPDSDGQPMADNTLQFQWIVTIEGGLDAQFRDNPDVFVAGDLLWYPVEGDNTIRQAPDILVALGRPKGRRESYRQWEEGGIAPQVVFEILSPGNRVGAMIRKFRFCERYEVEEYFIYDPDDGELTGYLREGNELREVPSMQSWVSPRLGVRFDMIAGELQLWGSDNRRFATYIELAAQRDQAQHERDQALQQADQLRAQLKALGIDPPPAT